jgi:prepilin-type N-terminal cleavage/methylation domain-containing protein
MSRRGMTLAECLIGLVVSAVLTAAVGSLLLAGARLARTASAALAVQRNVRVAALVLRAELHGLSAAAGDLLAISDSALALRVMRGTGFLCAAPANGAVVLDDSLSSLLRAPDPARDSVLLFAESDPSVAADDRWVHAAVGAVGRGNCASGVVGTMLSLASPSLAADLLAVTAGAPVRLFEVAEYRRYRDAAGDWWLGVRGPAPGGGWAATSPIAGPLLPSGGLVFRFDDSAGVATATPARVVLVSATLRGVAKKAAAPGLWPRDSVTARVAVREP